jgi:hypothetical protein
MMLTTDLYDAAVRNKMVKVETHIGFQHFDISKAPDNLPLIRKSEVQHGSIFRGVRKTALGFEVCIYIYILVYIAIMGGVS